MNRLITFKHMVGGKEGLIQEFNSVAIERLMKAKPEKWAAVALRKLFGDKNFAKIRQTGKCLYEVDDKKGTYTAEFTGFTEDELFDVMTALATRQNPKSKVGKRIQVIEDIEAELEKTKKAFMEGQASIERKIAICKQMLTQPLPADQEAYYEAELVKLKNPLPDLEFEEII